MTYFDENCYFQNDKCVWMKQYAKNKQTEIIKRLENLQEKGCVAHWIFDTLKINVKWYHLIWHNYAFTCFPTVFAWYP